MICSQRIVLPQLDIAKYNSFETVLRHCCKIVTTVLRFATICDIFHKLVNLRSRKIKKKSKTSKNFQKLLTLFLKCHNVIKLSQYCLDSTIIQTVVTLPSLALSLSFSIFMCQKCNFSTSAELFVRFLKVFRTGV